eukprot:TRINITY_DN32289_c0_g1_i1.p3 TRINITY_DN32289_c0_g1~~TRINITY_DN32289_c0_g1_i1.p3  ORF type:complete len:133 (+),score=23.91 TRINITY_DN32289_c0_g1_i1:209-607(+)
MYAARGFKIVPFPCNQFMKQESKSAAQIKTFIEGKGLSNIMAVTTVSRGTRWLPCCPVCCGSDEVHPLWAALQGGQEVRWNFEKFLIGREGQVLERFGEGSKGLDGSHASRKILDAVEKALGAGPPPATMSA